MLKSLVALLLSKFVNVSEKPNLGTLDWPRAIAQEFPCTVLNQYNTKTVVAPYSGFVTFMLPFTVTAGSIHTGIRGDYSRADSVGGWLALNAVVEKGDNIIFDAYPKVSGTAIIRFIPYKNT